MSDTPSQPPPGWYYAQGDPPGTQRYWNGSQWQGGPQPVGGPGQMPPVQPPPGQVSFGDGSGAPTGTANLAEPLSRIGARLIDLAIWIVITMVLAVSVGGGTAGVGQTSFSGRSWFAGVISTLIIAAYEVYMVANKGGTLGKLAVGLRVVNEDGSPADMNTAVKRVIVYLIGIVPVIGGIITFFAGIASIIMLFTDARNQTVWDKIAKTIVVKQ